MKVCFTYSHRLHLIIASLNKWMRWEITSMWDILTCNFTARFTSNNLFSTLWNFWSLVRNVCTFKCLTNQNISWRITSYIRNQSITWWKWTGHPRKQILYKPRSMRKMLKGHWHNRIKYPDLNGEMEPVVFVYESARVILRIGNVHHFAVHPPNHNL